MFLLRVGQVLALKNSSTFFKSKSGGILLLEFFLYFTAFLDTKISDLTSCETDFYERVISIKIMESSSLGKLLAILWFALPLPSKLARDYAKLTKKSISNTGLGTLSVEKSFDAVFNVILSGMLSFAALFYSNVYALLILPLYVAKILEFFDMSESLNFERNPIYCCPKK